MLSTAEKRFIRKNFHQKRKIILQSIAQIIDE